MNNDIFLLKDLKHVASVLIHESEIGDCMSYSRFNKDLMSNEYLGYAGRVEKDDVAQYSRLMMPNTLFHRGALVVEPRDQFKLKIRIDQIRLKPEYPMYNLYIYHTFGQIQNQPYFAYFYVEQKITLDVFISK